MGAFFFSVASPVFVPLYLRSCYREFMEVFEVVIALLLGGAALAAVARRVGAPYPALVALAGAALALIPGVPTLVLDPELALALFVAPVLVDAAFDASPRDLRANWRAVPSLALGAVALTIAVVAVVARLLVPGHAVGGGDRARRHRRPARRRGRHHGAQAAPPAAPAARDSRRREPLQRRQRAARLPARGRRHGHRLPLRLERAADAARGHARQRRARAGARPARRSFISGRINDVATAVVFQFCGTFGVWILAERLHLSGIITMVVFAMAASRRAAEIMPARIRIPSWAVWEVRCSC